MFFYQGLTEYVKKIRGLRKQTKILLRCQKKDYFVSLKPYIKDEASLLEITNTLRIVIRLNVYK